MKALFKTGAEWSALIVRLTLALVIFPHGAQKVLGWFGGYGVSGTLNFFTHVLHVPVVLAVLVFVLEFLGPLGLVVGLLTRVVAAGLLVEMIDVIVKMHGHNGFFMNWSGKQAGEGFEYHLLIIGMALALLISGAGRWSLDRLIGELMEEGEA